MQIKPIAKKDRGERKKTCPKDLRSAWVFYEKD